MSSHQERSFEGESRIFEREQIYNQSGVTEEGVARKIQEIGERRVSKNQDGYLHTESFYFTSSDSLTEVEKIDVKGKRVATVAGSGDFAQVFLANGASEITIFDISPYACFYQELKLVANENLTFEEYNKLFENLQNFRNSYGKNSKGKRIIDHEIYQKIRTKLSSQARTMLDTLLSAPGFEVGNDYEAGNGFFRIRFSENFNYKTQDEDTYRLMQEKIRSTGYKIYPQDVTAIERNSLGSNEKFDCIYLSNIGYSFNKSTEMSQQLLGTKTERVICSISRANLSNELYLQSEFFYLLPSGEIKGTRHMTSEEYDSTWKSKSKLEYETIYSEDSFRAENLDPKFKTGIPLKDGESFEYNGLTIRIIGYDPQNRGYNIILEITKK